MVRRISFWNNGDFILRYLRVQGQHPLSDVVGAADLFSEFFEGCANREDVRGGPKGETREETRSFLVIGSVPDFRYPGGVESPDYYKQLFAEGTAEKGHDEGMDVGKSHKQGVAVVYVPSEPQCHLHLVSQRVQPGQCGLKMKGMDFEILF